jgi:hypothetical protein
MFIPLQDISMAKAIAWNEISTPVLLLLHAPGHDDSLAAKALVKRCMQEHPTIDYYAADVTVHSALPPFLARVFSTDLTYPQLILLLPGRFHVLKNQDLRYDLVDDLLSASTRY